MDMEFLKRKAGPLTYGEWVLIGAAGIGAAYWIRRKYSTTNPNSVANAYDPLGNSAVSPAGSVITGTASGGSSGSSNYTSNSQWGNAAVDALVKAGIAPATATQAIADYLAGNVLSTSEQALVSQAIGLVGNPPGGPIGLVTTSPTTSGTGVTGSGGDTGTSNTGSTGSVGGYVDNTPAAGGYTGSTGTISDTTGSSAGSIPGISSNPSPPAIGGSYIVKSGDNWLTVASRAGVSEAELLAVNSGRGPSALRIGETIYLPAGAHTPVSTATGGSTSSGTSTQTIAGYYTVVSGDNWVSVASRAGVGESALLSANSSRGPAALRIGERIAIPSPGHVPVSVSVSTGNSSSNSSGNAPSKPTSVSSPTIVGYYVVQRGDNWIDLAYTAGVSLNALLAANASRGPSALRVYESIAIPAPGHVPATISAPTSGTVPTNRGSENSGGGGGGDPSLSYGRTYVVRSGDNWNTVASAFGMSTSQLLSLNSGRGPSALRIGETLVV